MSQWGCRVIESSGGENPGRFWISQSQWPSRDGVLAEGIPSDERQVSRLEIGEMLLLELG